MRWTLCAVLASSVASGSACTPAATPARASTMETRLLPDIEVSGLKDERVRLRDVTHGKVAVIDLWATWCKACKEVSAQAEALAREHHGGDVVVIGVDEGEEKAVVSAYLEGREPPYPIYLDPRLSLSDRLGITELPTVIVLDREGRVIKIANKIDDELKRTVARLAGDQGAVMASK
jgi:thiol-disulfide isomerase/thioredoxin